MRALALLVVVAALGVAGCGGGDDSAAPDPKLGGRGAETPVLVAALGDSITAGSPQWDPDPAVRDQLGTAAKRSSQYEYWAQRRLPGVRFRNCGVFGERTDEIARRLDACARGAQRLIVQGGINDIAQGRSIAAAARNLRGMAERGKSLRMGVALTEVLPWNNGPPGADRSIRALNRRIHAIGRELGVPVYGWYTQLEDPGVPGQMHPDWTIDGDHPSVEGYRRIADLVKLPGAPGR